MSIESVMPSNHLILILCLLLLPSIFPSIRVFSNEPVLHIRQPKYWHFSFSISPSKEYSGLISFRIDWFDLLAIQRTLKSLLQHHNSKASAFPEDLPELEVEAWSLALQIDSLPSEPPGKPLSCWEKVEMRKGGVSCFCSVLERGV